MERDGQISLWKLFFVMAKIGSFTIGGGYAMLLLIQREITSRGWISDKEFPDLIALAQATPGLLAVNISIFAGYRIRGIRGATVATLGSCLPPFLIILAIAVFFSSYADNPFVQKVFAGMRPAVVALILVPMIKMSGSSCKKWWQWLLSGATMALVAFMRVSPIYILIVVIVMSLSITLIRDKRGRGI